MKSIVSKVSGVFALVMFLVALFVLRKELEGHTFDEIIIATESVPLPRLIIALGLTILCYLILTGYDLLAVRKYRGQLQLLSVMLNSFICHAMSINVGFSSLTGGSLRCCYYLRKGLSTLEVVHVVSFCLLTFWLGFLTLGGAIFVISPPAIPEGIPLPSFSPHVIGAFFLVAVTVYLLLGILRTEPLRFRRWIIPVIPPHISIVQILISASEWLLGSAVLWVLLPMHPELTYWHLLSFYLLAQILGLFSQVPSGLGVFESIVIALAPDDLNPSSVLGALLLYRLIFNLLPLSAAGLLLMLREAIRRRAANLTP